MQSGPYILGIILRFHVVGFPCFSVHTYEVLGFSALRTRRQDDACCIPGTVA